MGGLTTKITVVTLLNLFHSPNRSFYQCSNLSTGQTSYLNKEGPGDHPGPNHLQVERRRNPHGVCVDELLADEGAWGGTAPDYANRLVLLHS